MNSMKFKKIVSSPLEYTAIAFLFLSFFEFQPHEVSATGKVNYSFTAVTQSPVKSIAVIGDLQETSLLELCIGRESNDAERVLLINEITKQNPAMIVLLGDMVFDGSDVKEWRGFDKLLIPARQSKIPVYPVLGNHEYRGFNSTAENNFRSRFPQLKKSEWYIQKYDSIALVFLNSNRPDMCPVKWDAQQTWYERSMKQLDADSSVKAVITFLHHPAYTNSVVTGDEPDVQLAFVPAYVKSKKGLALISGHAHTYERFRKDGKTFIVSGGGGGPRVGLHDGIDFHKDLYPGSSPRPFHFLLLNRDSSGINITVKGLLKGKNIFFTMEEIHLPYEENVNITKFN
jgi:Icc-related predicted phosphoesterase